MKKSLKQNDESSIAKAFIIDRDRVRVDFLTEKQSEFEIRHSGKKIMEIIKEAFYYQAKHGRNYQLYSERCHRLELVI